MGFECPTDDFSSEDILKGGGGMPAPGFHHAQVESAQEYQGYCELTFLIVSPTDNLNKHIGRRIYYSGKDADKTKKAQQMCISTAIRLGMTTIAEFESAKQAGQPFSIDFERDSVGCQCIIEVAEEEYEKDGQKRTGVNVKGIYAITDATARGKCKLDAELASLAGIDANAEEQSAAKTQSQSKAAPSTQKTPPKSTPKQPPVTNGAKSNKWEDI